MPNGLAPVRAPVEPELVVPRDGVVLHPGQLEVLPGEH
jgi:hypothetical protein